VTDGSNQIWLDDVTCSGSETHIDQCSIPNGWGGHNCDHTKDVGIGCDVATSSTINAATHGVRVVKTSGTIVNSHGTFAVQGRVEVRKNGIWGTICNDNTDSYN